MGPDDQVECLPFAARIPARVCAARHLARECSGGGRGAAIFEPCAKCSTGAERADELVRLGHRFKPWKRFNVVKENRARAAMWRATLEAPSYRPPTIDTPPAADE